MPSNIGLYRLMLDNLTSGEHIIKFWNGATLLSTKVYTVLDVCDVETVWLKWLSNEGLYKTFPFNKFWEGKNNPVQLGTVNVQIYNLVDALTNKQNVGYNNSKTVSIVSEEVSEIDLLNLSEIGTSPRVYLKFYSKPWIEISAKMKSSVYRARKYTMNKVEIDCTLPDDYLIKMI